MDNLQWFKFSPSHWFMGRIQRCSEVAQARFLRLCCVYWNNECLMNIEDAEIELGEDEFRQLLKLKIIESDADGSLLIKFLDKQYEACLELGNKRSLAAKARWSKAKAMQLHKPAMQDNADKIRLEEIREDKRIEEESFSKFWNLYDKKQGTESVRKKWKTISDKDKDLILKHVPKYVAATPDKKFRKLAMTYLNQKTWLDEDLPNIISKPIIEKFIPEPPKL